MPDPQPAQPDNDPQGQSPTQDQQDDSNGDPIKLLQNVQAGLGIVAQLFQSIPGVPDQLKQGFNDVAQQFTQLAKQAIQAAQGGGQGGQSQQTSQPGQSSAMGGMSDVMSGSNPNVRPA